MNKIVKKKSSGGDMFMPELHLRQKFTYSACGSFTKRSERVKNFKETDYLNYVCKNELDKAYFAYGAAYSDSKDLANRTISHKILKDRAY